MRSARKAAARFIKGLTVAVLVLPLALMPLGGSACAAPCIPDGPQSILHCSMNASTPALPVHSTPSCCASELIQAKQYVSGQQKPVKRKAPKLRSAAAPSTRGVTLLSARGLSGTRFRPLSIKQIDRPLYVVHASFLV